jgi:hypothetical protein
MTTRSVYNREEIERHARTLKMASAAIHSDEHYSKVLEKISRYHGQDVAAAFDKYAGSSTDQIHYHHVSDLGLNKLIHYKDSVLKIAQHSPDY